MRIEVNCFATLAKHTPEGKMLELEEGATVRAVIAQLGIDAGDVKIQFINGVHVQPKAVLNDGDRLGLFPAVGGG